MHYVSSGQESTNSSCLALKLLVCLSLTGQKNVTFQLRKKRNVSHNLWRMSAEVHPMAGKRVSSQLLACLPQRGKNPHGGRNSDFSKNNDVWAIWLIIHLSLEFDTVFGRLGKPDREKCSLGEWGEVGYRENIRWSNARSVWTTE